MSFNAFIAIATFLISGSHISLSPLSTSFTVVSICVSVGFHDQTVYSAVFVVDTWMSLFRKNLENIMNGETSFQSGVPPPPEGPFSPTSSNQPTNDIETSSAYNPRARRPAHDDDEKASHLNPLARFNLARKLEQQKHQQQQCYGEDFEDFGSSTFMPI